MIAAGVLGAAAVGYWMYRRSNAENLGDAASRTGAAMGRKMEEKGHQIGSPGMVEEGQGLQAKKQ